MKIFKEKLQEKVALLKRQLAIKLLLLLLVIVACNHKEVKITEKQTEIVIPLEGDTLNGLHKDDNSIKCEVWNQKISSIEIDHLLILTDSIPELQWNYCFGVSECQFEYDHKYSDQFKVLINGGGWIRIISSSNNVSYRACKTEECWSYFLLEAMCDQNGESFE